MKFKLAVFVDDRVPRIVTALVTDYQIHILREIIYYLAFALVAPLSADHYLYCHKSTSLRC